MPNTGRAKITIVKMKDGKYKWKMTVRGKVVAVSLPSYVDKRRARQAVEAAKNNMATATITTDE